MLDAMRRGALNWMAKILLGILVVAFAVWGIGDTVRTVGRGNLATIGKTKITEEEFRQAYQEELSAIARRLGRRLTPEQAKLFGVDQRTLSRLVGSAAIDQHARELGLSVSEAGIADIVRSDPAFQGPDGRFSAERLRAHLNQLGQSEGYYLATRRKDELREQIADSLISGVAPPQSVIDLIHRFREETRVIDYISPDFDKLVKVADPDESKLREYHEQHRRQFVAPEMRKANVLLLASEEAKARVPVGDDEIATAYEAAKETYNIPEKRRIQQLSFPDRAAADKAYAELAKARNFKEAAAKLGFKESDIELGLLTRRGIIDPKIAEVAFTLKKNELSKPVEGQFAIVLVRVGDIEPGKQRTLDDVKGEIRTRLASERIGQEMHSLHDQVEQERSAGKSLKEIGAKLNLPFREIAETDRAGKTSAGKPAIEHADAAKVLEAVFGGTPGVEAEAIELNDGGYVWFDILSATPEKQKTFEEVKADVKLIYLDLEKRREIGAVTAKLIERLRNAETLEAVAKELGTKVQRTVPVTRSTVPQGLTQNLVQQAFAIPKGGASSAATADGKSRSIFRVADVVTAPDPTPEQAERLKVDLSRQFSADILDEYVGGLRTRLGFSVNEAALRQALGPQRDQPDSD